MLGNQSLSLMLHNCRHKIYPLPVKLRAVAYPALLLLVLQSYCAGAPCLMCLMSLGSGHSHIYPTSPGKSRAAMGHHRAMGWEQQLSAGHAILSSTDACDEHSSCGSVFNVTVTDRGRMDSRAGATAVVVHSAVIPAQPLRSIASHDTGPPPSPHERTTPILRI